MEDIIVTAQRRSENLRNVPISVSALSPAKIENLNVENLQDLQFATPGMTFSKGINFSLVNIRGLGSFNTNGGLEPAVATYIDGAYLERGFGAVYDVVDVESVQILRGPQGTLWGRNATGGAVLINTADPTQGFSARGSLEAGSIGHRRAEGMINLPISDTLSARVALRYRETGGYVNNLTTGKDLGWTRQFVARGKLAFEPSTSFKAVFQYQYDRTRASIDPAIEVLPTASCLVCARSRYSYPLDRRYLTVINNVNGGNGARDRSNFYNLEMNLSVGAAKITSITAYRKTNNFTAGDFDFTEVPAFNLAQRSGSKAFTQTLQVVTEFSGIANVAAGVDFLDDRSPTLLYVGAADTFDYTQTPALNYAVDTRSISSFAEVRLTPISALTVTAGGRFTHDIRDGSAPGVPSRRITFNSFTPRLVLAYDTGSTNLYLSYNRGFKAGGYSGAPLPANIFRPATVDSYEFGAKYQSPDNTLRANLAAFLYKANDIQVVAVNQADVGNIANANNAGKATGKGIDLELEYQASHALYVFGGVSFLDAKYDSYPGAQVQYAAGPVDLSGYRLPRAPRWTGNIGATARAPLPSDWTAEVTGTMRFSSSFDYTDAAGGPLGADFQKGFALVNLTGRVFPQSDRYEINFFINNLTDRYIDQYRFTTAPFGAFRIPAPPRTYGVGVSFKI